MQFVLFVLKFAYVFCVLVLSILKNGKYFISLEGKLFGVHVLQSNS